MTISNYNNGQIGVSIEDESKAGFIYYPNGKVAVVISTASSYQNAFYAYDKDKLGTLLLGLNENAIGFCSTSMKNSPDLPKLSLVFTKLGGVITNAEGNIIKDWVWNKKLATDTVLSEKMTVKLSDYITIIFSSKEDIFLEFECENIKYKVDMGTKVLRTKPNYLANAKRLPGGHLLPSIDHVTLKKRTEDFNISMRAQRNKLHPKSQNLSELVRDVVYNLEKRFDTLPDKMSSVPSLGTEWKSKSLSMTLNEIPHIPLCGQETGLPKGFSDQIYTESDKFDPSSTLPKNLIKNGVWKGSLEIRAALEDANPPIKRTFVLKSASGRYSNMIIVNPNAVTPQNPTGMVKQIGLPLIKMKWAQLKDIFKSAPADIIPGSPLIIGLIVRLGDPNCTIAKGIAEAVHLLLTKPENGDTKLVHTIDQTKNPIEMVLIDVGDDSSILSEFNVKSLPMFIMVNSGRIMYSGLIGGRKMHINSISRPQILIIEPTFKHQIAMEKTLRGNECDSFLCLDIQQALERLRQVSQGGIDGDPAIVFDLILVSEDVQSGDIDSLFRKVSSDVKSKRTVIVGLASVLGDHGKKNLNSVTWTDYCSFEVEKVIPGFINKICSVVTQKPIKASSIRKLLNLRYVPPEDVNFGLTTDTLISKIAEVQQSLTGPRNSEYLKNSVPSLGIKLSTMDVKMRGKHLIKS